MQDQDVSGGQQVRRENDRVGVAHIEIGGDAPGFMLPSASTMRAHAFRARRRVLLPRRRCDIWHKILLILQQVDSKGSAGFLLLLVEMLLLRFSETKNPVLRGRFLSIAVGLNP